MPQSTERDHGIQGLVSRQRWEEPEAAIAWANEIGDPGMRQRAGESAAHAFFRRDREGAMEWLPGSGLSAEVQQRILRGRGR